MKACRLRAAANVGQSGEHTCPLHGLEYMYENANKVIKQSPRYQRKVHENATGSLLPNEPSFKKLTEKAEPTDGNQGEFLRQETQYLFVLAMFEHQMFKSSGYKDSPETKQVINDLVTLELF
jgi:hypothetical protein